ncbi:protein phosphatase, putative [Entamoeba histolytica HM-3:IMSS]|uniref:Protein phosphatase, putative n=7 Tax=Entamoeba histolytica TaxID=5759 RepID=C4LVC9_ENTH1|nr:protein phosphatase, putative [Entamoeba histolytica HM-1:IMSS]EMD43898.1 protein phosphatase, putative [Entamoeba histolytica KU27]EMS18027.1 protein phosphatase, putative [Entamoeba histolytica HM-3:IMSS]ENY65925.1 protein phosphatase, putative [Entamoeba histolytica HM-1:IMSS-A]GAT92616.1 protein phosphatase putative [Entamoeba histolytica]EAL47764.1 protein phosphatase, putative [Entamoeba histolytica HM-1:IMSS]|eukprot:XP_653152.1 protein phosphatase, putative [Entamoeba histolytica HM-1:IMSS]
MSEGTKLSECLQTTGVGINDEKEKDFPQPKRKVLKEKKGTKKTNMSKKTHPTDEEDENSEKEKQTSQEKIKECVEEGSEKEYKYENTENNEINLTEVNLNEQVEEDFGEQNEDKPKRKKLNERKALKSTKSKKVKKEKTKTTNEVIEEGITVECFTKQENEVIAKEQIKQEKEIKENADKKEVKGLTKLQLRDKINEKEEDIKEEVEIKRKPLDGRKVIKRKKKETEENIKKGVEQEVEETEESLNIPDIGTKETKVEERIFETKEEIKTDTTQEDNKEEITGRKPLRKKKSHKKTTETGEEEIHTTEEEKKKKKRKKKVKKEKELEEFEKTGKNKYIEYSSGEDCNREGLRRAKKKPVGLNYFSEKKGLLTDEDLMEDEHYCGMSFRGDEKKSIFGIFDGYGGIGAARETRRTLPNIIQKLIEQGLDSKEILEKGFSEVDEGMNKEEFMDIGCTCTLIYIWEEDNKVYIRSGNVGDSTCFVKKMNKGKPEIITLSQDHKVTSACEQKRMKEAGITLVEGQKRINGVGVARTLANHFVKNLNIGMIGTPYISPAIVLESGDEIILCSDGIWDVITPEKAFEMMENTQVSEAPKVIMEESMKITECRDNVTVIVVKIL